MTLRSSEKIIKELFEAITKGDSTLVGKLLEKGKGTQLSNVENEKGESVLIRALKLKQKIIAYQLLEEHDIRPDLMCEEGTALHFAAGFGYSDLLWKMLLIMKQKNQDLTHLPQDSRKVTVGIAAAEFGHTHVLDVLINFGVELDDPGYSGYTPLHVAAKNGHLEFCNALLLQGANPNATGQNGFTPLHLACLAGKLEVVQSLMKSGSKLSRVTTAQETCIHLAARNGHIQIIKFLQSDLSFTKALNHQDKNGKNALHLAIERGKKETVKYLICCGINLNAQDSILYSPLHYSCRSNDLDSVKMLLECKNVNIDSISMDLETPLLVAIKRNFIAGAVTLIRAGCSITALHKLYTGIDLSNREVVIDFLQKQHAQREKKEMLETKGTLEFKGQTMFFKIQGGELLSYENTLAPRPKDAMVLSGCAVSEINPTTFFIYSQKFPDSNNKTLKSSNATDCQKWIQSLNQAIEKSKLVLDSAVEKHGFFTKKGQERWFVIKKIRDTPCLMWFVDHKVPEEIVPDKAKNFLPIQDCAVTLSEAQNSINLTVQGSTEVYHLRHGELSVLQEWTKHLERYTEHLSESAPKAKANWKTLFLTSTVDKPLTSKEDLENKLSIANDPAFRQILVESAPKLEVVPPSLKGIVGKIRGPGLQQDSIGSRVFGETKSSYPTNRETGMRQGDPVCDRYCGIQYDNALIVAIADGCGWGVPARDAALVASDTFVEYMQKVAEDIFDARKAVTLMLRAFHEAHKNIIGDKPMEEIFSVGTTTMIGGLSLRLPSATDDKGYLFICVNLGDCKAYIYRPQTRKVEDLTAGNRNPKDPRDPGGRLGPQAEGGLPDLRNLSVFSTIAQKDDIIWLCSDGVHDNLDPEHLGMTPAEAFPSVYGPKDKWDDMDASDLMLTQLKTDWACSYSSKLIADLPVISPATIAQCLVKNALDLTASSREWMETHPNDKLPDDFKAYPGKLDHTTCVAFTVGGSSTGFPMKSSLSPQQPRNAPVVPEQSGSRGSLTGSGEAHDTNWKTRPGPITLNSSGDTHAPSGYKTPRDLRSPPKFMIGERNKN